jgi:hypothetical protein
MWNIPNIYTSISKNCGKYKMQVMNSDLTTFKVNGFTHVQMLIVQKMRKN